MSLVWDAATMAIKLTFQSDFQTYKSILFEFHCMVRLNFLEISYFDSKYFIVLSDFVETFSTECGETTFNSIFLSFYKKGTLILNCKKWTTFSSACALFHNIVPFILIGDLFF